MSVLADVIHNCSTAGGTRDQAGCAPMQGEPPAPATERLAAAKRAHLSCPSVAR